MLTGTAWATEYFVAPGGSDGNGGTGWGDAFATISNAVAQSDASIVTVANGTYDITAQIAITNAITVRSFGGAVYGGLANASNTVVNALYGGDLYSGPRVFHLTHTNIVLDGLTITGGTGRGDNAPGSPGNEDGNGIFMTGGLVRNCIIRENGLPSGYDHCQGGGIYMSGGTVSNCTIQGNWTGGGTTMGAGVYAGGGQILDCRVLDNRMRSQSGAGIYASSPSVLIRNCLIAGNVTPVSGGGVYGGTVESCTIVDNMASSSSPATSSGGGVYGSAVKNSIVLDNQTGSGLAGIANYAGGSTFAYSSSSPEPPGVGNISSASFVDAAATNYQLLACAAVDAGTNETWMTGAVDLAGNPRISGPGNRVDMGAYEKQPGALECSFAADATSVQAPADVVFTALPSGTNLNITSYAWDFGDGQVASGGALAVVTNTYSMVGAHTVTLTINNNGGESASVTNVNYITVWGDYAYVSTNSPSPTVPYHSWSTAARVIANAITEAPAGTTVVLSNGTHHIADELVVDKAITVTSYGDGVYGGWANATNTAVDGPADRGSDGPRVVSVTHVGAVLDSLTITDGHGRLHGLGVYMTEGTVRNCIIRDNGTLEGIETDHAKGGGVYMTGGVVSNCTIQANQIRAGDTRGAGVYASGGLITHCRVLDNETESKSGGGIYAANSSVVIRNCLIARNSTYENGGGVYLNGGSIESCTIVTNVAGADGSGSGGGVYRAGGTVSNSIVYFNTGTGGALDDDLNTTGPWLGYSCAGDVGSATNGNITADPLFVDLAGGNYRLSTMPVSPCIDAGNSAGVTWPTDLDGNPRIFKKLDMGAYEIFVPPAGSVLIVR